MTGRSAGDRPTPPTAAWLVLLLVVEFGGGSQMPGPGVKAVLVLAAFVGVQDDPIEPPLVAGLGQRRVHLQRIVVALPYLLHLRRQRVTGGLRLAAPSAEPLTGELGKPSVGHLDLRKRLRVLVCRLEDPLPRTEV